MAPTYPQNFLTLLFDLETPSVYPVFFIRISISLFSLSFFFVRIRQGFCMCSGNIFTYNITVFVQQDRRIKTSCESIVFSVNYFTWRQSLLFYIGSELWNSCVLAKQINQNMLSQFWHFIIFSICYFIPICSVAMLLFYQLHCVQ